MEKMTIILTLSFLSLAFSPLVSGLCDSDTLARCTNSLSSALGGGFSGQQNTFAMMEIYCRQDVQDAIICIGQESANCLEDISYSSAAQLLRMVNAETLQENCNVLSNIPKDALNCLGNALDLSNTRFSQCILSVSKNVLDSLTKSGIQGQDFCSMIRPAQKCQDQAIEYTCPNYKNALFDYSRLSNKFFSCSDSNGSAGKTSMTPILFAACFAILKLLFD